ncbi:MAG: DUF4168 domain-containing protein [Gammaproteobacteria bacterium]
MRKLAFSILPLALLVAPLALASPPPQPLPVPAGNPAGMNVNSAMLHKFAAAYEDVRPLRTKYMGKFEAAKSDKQKTAIKQEAMQDIKQAISKHMPLSQYKRVAKAVHDNPAVRKRLIKILQADEKKAAPPMHGG